MMVTTTLFNFIKSELINKGHNEIVEENDSKYFDPPLDFLWIDDDKQFTTKIIRYDEEIQEIMNKMFSGLSLEDPDHDEHFKRSFLLRFVNRQINRQTIEAFQMELLNVFLMNEDYLNRMYEDIDLYVNKASVTEQENQQLNNQETDGENTTDNRSAFIDLPQSKVNINVDDLTVSHASDNTVTRNKQKNNQVVSGESQGKTDTKNLQYEIDELLKSSGLLEQVLNKFDEKCFLQIW